METAEWSVEDESREGGVVVVSNADIDPRAVVVHLHNTPGVGGIRVRCASQRKFTNSK